MRTRIHDIVRTALILLAVIFAVPALAQNTKGDRPVKNQRQVRETKGKVIKKKGRVTTRDIAGRRLRTKNKSSVNRANVGIPQPITTQRQPRRYTDKAAPAPANKRFASKERRSSDPDRSWQGDISGYKPRKIKPSSAEETGRNVYKQRGYTTRHPTGDRPFKSDHSKTASGKPIVKRTPKHSERAWKGDIKGQPFYAPKSATGRMNNVYPQKTKYSKYVSKNPSPKDRSFDNRAKIAKAKRLGTDTSPKNWRRSVMSVTGQAPYVTRGRKNVYWGKMKRTEKANLRDPAGRPLSKKNFRSSGIGLIGTDTLLFFGRKPHGDTPGALKRNGKYIPGSEAKGGWLNDIAGYRLRRKKPGSSELPGTHEYSGYRSISGRFRTNRPVQGKAPGIGAGAVARHLKKTNGGSGKNFQDQGGAFTGYLKGRKQNKFAGSKTGALWNNNRRPIPGKGVSNSGLRAGRYSGHIKGRAEKDFADQGSGFTGVIKERKQFQDQGGAFTGYIKSGGKNFADQGSGFTGYIKAKKPYKFKGGSLSGRVWNNDRTPIQGKLLPGGADRAGRFSGHTKGRAEKDFADQGSGFTGYIKAKKPYKFTGNSSGDLWNNKEKSTTQLDASKADAAAGTFQGRKKTRGQEKGKMMATPNKLWNNNEKSTTQLDASRADAAAGTFQGRSKAREKGKMLLTPARLWNNNEKAVTQLETTKLAAKAGYYKGGFKAKEQKKGKIMSSPNTLWNNDEKATTVANATKAGMAAGVYQGRSKAKEKGKHILASNTAVWNNKGKATTQIEVTSAAEKAGQFQGGNKSKKESKDRDYLASHRTFKREYTQNPHSVDEAIKKEKPNVNYKAGRYASGFKIDGKRSQHPHSNDDAVDGYHVKAIARTNDYQGNVKMKKFFDRRQSPDAKFVHNGENNVKEERTIVTNVKLFWAKLFQKSESQPSNLKDRSDKLRYDKREKGMWAD